MLDRLTVMHALLGHSGLINLLGVSHGSTQHRDPKGFRVGVTSSAGQDGHGGDRCRH